MRIPEVQRRMLRMKPEMQMLIEDICILTGRGIEAASVWINQGPAEARAQFPAVAVAPARATLPVAPSGGSSS